MINEGLKYHLENKISIFECIYRPGSQKFFEFFRNARKKLNENYSPDEVELLSTDIGRFGIYEGNSVPLDLPIEAEIIDSLNEADVLMTLSDKGYHTSEEILTKVFDNEFGNEIEIEVRNSNHDDFLDDEEPYDGVYIRMTGPNSETGNVMTRMEAQNLLELLKSYFEESLEEGKKKKKSGTLYKGRKVKLNKPARGGKKKFYVYVRDPKTKKVKKVSFGAKGMTTGLRDPDRRKSFKARHRCEKKKDKTKPGYWACRIGRYPKVTGAPYTTWW